MIREEIQLRKLCCCFLLLLLLCFLLLLLFFAFTIFSCAAGDGVHRVSVLGCCC